ncbi:Low-specificity L-threonine aldolase [Purpureocillium takamizusanense]|uniref:Low-specificity L-threonine aldolase n=1 Tax=Purpureocillium takamizusanense TaxID=2060973 RepID=A0A9Q8QCW3_9HYPO|nr:Low-specificity L-threonine aldolase [Purpureocillium takamizusanense]UNI18369.1 Low-specificity L-threonine aldolase [Purpureocillium takamizusanense]
MLGAIVDTSLGDDEFHEDSTTHSLQAYVAGLVGHEASLLVLSGTMGNQVAIRAALRSPPYSLVADNRAHVATYGAGGMSTICGAVIKPVMPSNGHHLTLDDVQRHSTTTETMYDYPTRVISLENTLLGTIMPLADARAISQWARSQTPPIHMHLDGARVWEAVAAGAFTLREIAQCFDSMQLCLAKGIGAPLGSVVVGSSRFIERARWSRHFMGGGMRASGIIAAPARVAIDNVFLGGKLKRPQEMARRASALWEQLGGKLLVPTETNMVVLNLEASGLAPLEFHVMARKFGVKTMDLVGARIVFHYQVSEDSFQRLCDLFEAIMTQGSRV